VTATTAVQFVGQLVGPVHAEGSVGAAPLRQLCLGEFGERPRVGGRRRPDDHHRIAVATRGAKSALAVGGRVTEVAATGCPHIEAPARRTLDRRQLVEAQRGLRQQRHGPR
jgi:hypothetical protein